MSQQLQNRRLQQYFVPKSPVSEAPAPAPSSTSSPAPNYYNNNPWGGGVSLNYGSRVGFAAGAAIGIIILICIFILVCDRRRRPYIGSTATRPLGARGLYNAQPVDAGPKQVQLPVIIVNPDNEVECGRKLHLDETPSAKLDPDNYFTSIGPGPPLFEASVPYVHGLASHGSQNLSTSFRAAPSGSFRSFRQRLRPSSESFRSEQATPRSFVQDPQQAHDVVPLHTSDGVIPGTAAPLTASPVAEDSVAPQRSFFRSPFADWNPATGLANDTRDSNQVSVEMTRAQSNSRA